MSFRLRIEALEDRWNPVGPELLDPTAPAGPGGSTPPANPAPETPPPAPTTPPAQQEPDPTPVPGHGY